MKKYTLLPMLAVILLTYFACRRSDTKILSEKLKDPFVREAAGYIKSQISEAEFESLDIENYSTFKKTKTEVFGVRFTVKGTEGKKFAVIAKTDKGFIGNWVDISQLNTGNIKDGTLLTYSFSGDKKSAISFVKSRVVKFSRTVGSKTRTAMIRYGANGERIMASGMAGLSGPDMEEEWQWLPEVTVTSYKNNATTPVFFSLYYYFNQSPSYLYTYTTQDPYSGGSGSTSYAQDVTVVEPVSSSVKADINKLIKCFNNIADAGASYKVTLCADLPVNNDPSLLFKWNTATPGHSFVILTKTNGAEFVTQVFGFYPTTKLSIFDLPVNSQIKNDSQHQYDASISMTVDKVNFDAVKNMAVSASTMKYDLNDYNCTDYALQVFNAGRSSADDIVLDDTIEKGPYWNSNYGRTPNALYSTLKAMKDFNTPEAPNVQTGTLYATTSNGVCN